MSRNSQRSRMAPKVGAEPSTITTRVFMIILPKVRPSRKNSQMTE